MAHLADDPLPEGVYEPSEAAIVRYAQASARNNTITDALYKDLADHFPTEKIVQISFVCGLAGLTNRFHMTFLTEVDSVTREATSESCPMQIPRSPQEATSRGT